MMLDEMCYDSKARPTRKPPSAHARLSSPQNAAPQSTFLSRQTLSRCSYACVLRILNLHSSARARLPSIAHKMPRAAH
jgi:hypothetical protein